MLKQKTIRFALLLALLLLISATVIAQDKVQVRWYVGLGAGTDAPVIPQEEALVAEYNASQSEIELVLEIVDVDQAYNVLSTQIAAGNAPDIIGPMGVRGRASFPGAWLDLTSLIESTSYDLSDFDPALVDFYKIEGEGQLGIPFAVFPSFLLYNKDLFDEAGIPYPPAAYGEPYIDWDGVEREWNIDTLREVAMLLTVDANGNDATMEGFDTENIVQFGFGSQFNDLRGRDTLFGSGNFVDAEGNAVIPDNWRVAEEWFHQAMWEDFFHPNGVYGNSELLGGAGGNWFNTGNIAMITMHTWFMGWGTADLDAAWDFAALPSYNGVVTAKLHADTFGIMNTSQHPEEAFAVLGWLLGEKAETLSHIYNALPARLSLQPAYLEGYTASLAESYPDVDWANLNWDVVFAGLAHPDNPNHQEGMPSFSESESRYGEFTQLADNDAAVDVNAELDKLQTDLQAIFDAAE
jgi:multiple sugar transport system substrate-binding protein